MLFHCHANSMKNVPNIIAHKLSIFGLASKFIFSVYLITFWKLTENKADSNFKTQKLK